MSNYTKRGNSKGTKKFGSTTKDGGYDKRKSNDRKESSNDPSWYAMDPSLLKDSASIPYSWAVGTPINRDNPALTLGGLNQYYTVPGIVSMYTSPSVGYSDSKSSAINVAAANLFANLRKVNSGYSNYNAPDLMIYLLALDQMYSFINFAQRAYGIARLFAQKNRYVPDGLLAMNCLDAGDLQANLANFRYRLNVLINKVASFSVPAFLPIFKRHAFMYSQVYIEGVSMKDQLYQFVPESFWKFDYDQTTQAGKLSTVQWRYGGMYRTVDQLMEFGEDLINPIFTNEDFNIMSGDIRKAYGEDVIKLAPVSEDYLIIPTYDVAVLEQFKNAVVPSITGSYCAIGGFDVVQSPDDVHTLIHTPTIAYATTDAQSRAAALAAMALCQDKLITTKAPEPTPELTMENTRLSVAGYDIVRNADETRIELHGGAEIPMVCLTLAMNVDASGNVSGFEFGPRITYDTATYVDADANTWAALFTGLSRKMAFEFMPEVTRTMWRNGTSAGSVQIAYAEHEFQVDNYALITPQTMARMHEAAMMSLLHVPPVSRA